MTKAIFLGVLATVMAIGFIIGRIWMKKRQGRPMTWWIW